MADFATVLKQDPDSIEARNALDENHLLLRERNRDLEPEESRCYPGPPLTCPKVELESVSDSSDWNHVGNGLPCLDYNHDGCKRGDECEFSHAPDYASVRDRLYVSSSDISLLAHGIADFVWWPSGRNVCVHFLLGNCSAPCEYSHDKTYLPSGRWWESEEGLQAAKRVLLEWRTISRDPECLPKCLAALDGRIAWKPAHTAKTEEADVWRDRVMMLEGLIDATDNLKYAAFSTRGMGDGRTSNWEFTEDAVNMMLGEMPGEKISWNDGVPGRWYEDENYVRHGLIDLPFCLNFASGCLCWGPTALNAIKNNTLFSCALDMISLVMYF